MVNFTLRCVHMCPRRKTQKKTKLCCVEATGILKIQIFSSWKHDLGKKMKEGNYICADVIYINVLNSIKFSVQNNTHKLLKEQCNVKSTFWN